MPTTPEPIARASMVVDREVMDREVVVPAASARFEGHFPGAPIFPAVATLHDLVLPAVSRAWPELVALAALRRLKFATPIRPDAEVTVRLVRAPGTRRVDFTVFRGAVTYAGGTLHFREAP